MQKHALTFDVEDWYQGFIKRGLTGWERYGSRELRNVQRILEILDDTHTKATFFVLGSFAHEQAPVVRMIHSSGHEIATHGYAHRPIGSLGPSGFREDLRRSLNLLEDVTGEKVHGHRATDWSLTTDCLWALKILAEEGIEYDSSVFPTRLHPHGIPSSPLQPYRLSLDSSLSIYEFPAQVFSFGPIRVPASGGFFLRALPLKVSEWALQQSERRGHSGMVYLHPYDLDAEVPVLKVTLSFRILRYYNLQKTEDYLRHLLRRFSFVPVQEIKPSLPKDVTTVTTI